MTLVNGDSKSIPIRCLIETPTCTEKSSSTQPPGLSLPAAHCTDGERVRWMERECFAIVPSGGLFRDVVKTALLKLGYSEEDVAHAKGSVQLKNWRALDLDYVTDNALASVEDMLGDLTTVATLRIKISSGRKDEDVKDKLLLMLLAQSYDCLQKSGCPIAKEDVEKVIAGQKEFSPTAQNAFYTWYHRQQGLASTSRNLPLLSTSPRTQSGTASTTTTNTTTSESITLPETATAPTTCKATRLRISFDPDEVSRLQKWFDLDSHPSRHQMTSYLAELNSLPVRSTLKPLDLTNIMYWFKNARAAARRSGRSITSDDLSDDDDRQSDKEGSTMSAPPLPNSNAIYMIRDPIVKSEAGVRSDGEENRAEDGRVDTPMHQPPHCDEESDMEEDLSVTDDDEDDIDEDEGDDSIARMHLPNSTPDPKISELRVKQEEEQVDPANPSTAQPRVSKPNSTSSSVTSTAVSSSSPNLPTAGSFMNMASRLPSYAFPYSALPMAYIQSQMNPFYKDWTEKVQSAVAHAQANTAQQNVNLVKASSRSECELSKAERQKRHRAFIDPVSEIPKLEQWFTKDTHPSHYVIEQICDDLNRGEFRSRYPKLSPKNIQLWFKNHRAKVKRMRVGGGKLNLSFGAPQLSPPSGLSMPLMD